MMHKFFVIVLAVVLIATNGLLFGCAPGAPPVPTEMKDLKVELDSATPIFAGQESIIFAPVWTINNPNDFPVTVEEFSYNFYGEEMLIGKAALRGIYIPANTSIKVSDACVLELAGLNGPIVKLFFAGDIDEMKAWADESNAPGIIALVDKLIGMIDQLSGLSKALGGASMAAEAVAAGKDGEATAKLRATADKLAAALNSPKMAGMLGPGAGDKLAAAADHAEAGNKAALVEDAKSLKELAGILNGTVVKLVQGTSATAAMTKWKPLGGGLPSSLYTILAPNDLKDAWDTIPAKSPSFKSEGKVRFSSVVGEKTISFAGLTWTAG